MTEVKTFKEIEILIKNAENAFCKERIKVAALPKICLLG